MDNFSQLVDRLAQASGLLSEEIERKIEAKRAKLSGLISKEGAAQIVAAELGVSLDKELLKLSELVEGMKRVRAIGKITTVFPVRSYNKQGREGSIGSFLLGDENSNVRTVLWDAHHIDLLTSGEIKEGSIIEIGNASVRNGELHLGAFSTIKHSTNAIGEVKTSRSFGAGKFLDARPGSYMKVRATVVQIFDPKFFEDKKEAGKQRALVNFVLDDGTETMRCLFNDGQLEKLGFSREDVFSPEIFAVKKQEVLGEERIFVGSFKTNAYFNKLEMNVESVEDINVDILIKELENG